MITILVNKHNGEYSSLQAYGHAEYDEPGRDIICAAVSILVINTANAIETFTKDLFSSDIHEDGTTEILLSKNISHDTVLLMDSLMLGLDQIRQQYGKKYLKIEYKEV